MNSKKPIITLILGLMIPFFSSAQRIIKCTDTLTLFPNDKAITSQIQQTPLNVQELVDFTRQGISLVPEFQFIQSTAEKMGIRVWLFGGTASSFLHYVKWDLLRIKNLKVLQTERFDYDYTNIFRSTQDLDIVIDSNPEKAIAFQKIISEKYPYFLGAKSHWEIRTLRHRMGHPGEFGFKEALLNDPDFNNQNSDSNSLGMIELTRHPRDPMIRDLKSWDDKSSVFLEDTLKNQIQFFRSAKHFTTYRAMAGENPEILSIIRILVKAFQYELSFSKSDFDEIKLIVNQFDESKITNKNALKRIQDTAKKLIIHAVNLEYAINTLDKLGLRQKLIAMGNLSQIDSTAWWLNREPLRSFPLGKGNGPTAEELKIKIVAHETNNLFAYESITRSHTGAPNVLISRTNHAGETAAHGNGFYTRLGKLGAKGTGFTVRFNVDPAAREGTDFTVIDDYIVFKNKKALTVIQESLNFNINDLLKLTESDQKFLLDPSNLALLEKFKRKLNFDKINNELSGLFKSHIESEQFHLIEIVTAFQNSIIKKIIDPNVFNSIINNIYEQMQPYASSNEFKDRLRYVQTIGPILESLYLLDPNKSKRFLDYLNRLIQTPQLKFEMRKQILFEQLLVNKNLFISEHYEQLFNVLKIFSKMELDMVIDEIRNWHKDRNIRKREFITALNQRWSLAIKHGEVNLIRSFIDVGLFKINDHNISDCSLLQLAAYYKQNQLIQWLIENKEFNLNSKNKLGYNEIEQLHLSGKTQLAGQIAKQRPDVPSRLIKLTEKNSDNSPIISFIRFEAGSFMMGEPDAKILTTFTQPFEIMSVPTTQYVYKMVAELLNKIDPNNYKIGFPTIASGQTVQINFKDIQANTEEGIGDQFPMVNINYDEVLHWIKGLNQLSQLDNFNIQKTLVSLFPGHKIGNTYRLPTNAEWEYVARLGGGAEGYFSHGDSSDDVLEFFIFLNENNGDITNGLQTVGSKKPVFYHGKPIYDIQGNIWEMTSDMYTDNLVGGTNPNIPINKLLPSNTVIRGGGYLSQHYDTQIGKQSSLPSMNHYSDVHLGVRSSENFKSHNPDVGFRLIRVIE